MHPVQPLAATDIKEGIAGLFTARRRIIDEQCRRFVEVGNAESLHDLRVAMRRLHSLFAAFDPVIPHRTDFAVALKALLKGTNPARDLEVALAILHSLDLQLPWLQQQWQRELEAEYRRLRSALPETWQAIAPVLDTPQQLLRQALPPQPLGELTAGLLKRRAKTLKKRRSRLCGQWTDRRAHRLRIAGKQLRYLCEPFAGEEADIAGTVLKLKDFQDLLGDYHDIVVLQKKLKALQQGSVDSGQQQQLKQACKQLEQRRRQLKRQFTRRYCGKHGKKMNRRMSRTATLLAKR